LFSVFRAASIPLSLDFNDEEKSDFQMLMHRHPIHQNGRWSTQISIFFRLMTMRREHSPQASASAPTNAKGPQHLQLCEALLSSLRRRYACCYVYGHNSLYASPIFFRILSVDRTAASFFRSGNPLQLRILLSR
jgi:hypothetical protein